jgi:hypothetical protein
MSGGGNPELLIELTMSISESQPKDFSSEMFQMAFNDFQLLPQFNHTKIQINQKRVCLNFDGNLINENLEQKKNWVKLLIYIY